MSETSHAEPTTGATTEPSAGLPSHQPRLWGQPTPLMADLVPQVRSLMASMERALDDAVGILDIVDPGWETRLTPSSRGPRPPLVDFYCYLWMAWVGAAYGVAFDAGASACSAIGRDHQGSGLELVTVSPYRSMDFNPVPTNYPRAPIDAHMPVATQREYVKGWLASTAEWALLLVRIADRQDSTWQDMSIVADGPGACGALVHLWTARKAVEALGHQLRLPESDFVPFPARARVERLRYASGSHLETDAATSGPVGAPPADLRQTRTSTDAASEPISHEARVLRERRMAAGWTQAELAERMGSSAAQVSMVETGKVRLTEAFAKRYRAALDPDTVSADPEADPDTAASAAQSSAAAPPASLPALPALAACNHAWMPFPDTTDGSVLPLLVRCSECGLSRLLAAPSIGASDASPDNSPGTDHQHSFEVLFNTDAEPTLLWCECTWRARIEAP